jgi:hypothetical protein
VLGAGLGVIAAWVTLIALTALGSG